MRIGFTTTTVRQIKSVEEVVDIAKKVGADCLEWGGDIHITDVASAEKARKLCDASGISVAAYGSYYRVGSNNADEWKKICEIASVLGARCVRVWLGKSDSEVTDEKTYEMLVTDAKSMCAVAAEYSIAVCCECHPNTYNNNTDAFLKIREDIGCDNFKTYFQSLYRRREYDLDRIERTAPFTDCVHISYSEQRREQFPKHNPNYINDLLDKIVSVGFDEDILIEFTYISMRYGLPNCLKKDIARLKHQLRISK